MNRSRSTHRQILIYAKRLLLRDRRRWLGLLIGVILGVAGLVSIEGVVLTTRHQLNQEARDLMGADLLLSAWRPLSDPWSLSTRHLLQEQGRVSETVELASMARVLTTSEKDKAVSSKSPSTLDDSASPRLISLKGISEGYPLRGQLRITSLSQGNSTLGSIVSKSATDLSTQEAWVAPSIWRWLDEAEGTPSIVIGGKILKIAGVIHDEPDAGISGALSFAPRVLVRKEVIDELGLIQLGSRVQRKLAFVLHPMAEEQVKLQEIGSQLKMEAPEYIRVQLYTEAQPNSLQLFERIAIFFSLVALVGLCLCLLAMSSSAWGLLTDHLPLIATARLLGVTSHVIRDAYRILIVTLGILGGVIGLVVGGMLQWLLTRLISEYVEITPTWIADETQVIWSLGVGLWMSMIVNTLAQRGLRRVEAQQLWSQAVDGLPISPVDKLIGATLTAFTIGVYVWHSSGSVLLSLGFVVGLGVLIGIISSFTFIQLSLIRICVRATRTWKWPAGLLFAIKQILGYQQRVWIALMSLGVSSSLIGGLLLVGESFNQALQVDDEYAPQLFLIDIQPDQRTLLRTTFEELGLEPPDLRSLIRARIAAMNGKPITREMLQGSTPAEKLRARSLTREYNLTTQEQLSLTEELYQGKWWSDHEAKRSDTFKMSVEYRYAKRMGLQLGDEITFDLQGREMTFRIESFRQVNWLSFAPNFLFVLPPGPLEGAPQTWIGAARLPDEDHWKKLSRLLFKRLPNVSLIDLRPILAEGRRLLASLTAALTLTGGVCLIAGLLLMITDLRRDRRRRVHSVQLLNQLGVPKRQAKRWITIELGLIGLLSSSAVVIGVWGCAKAATHVLNIPLVDPSSALSAWALFCVFFPILVVSLSRQKPRLLT